MLNPKTSKGETKSKRKGFQSATWIICHPPNKLWRTPLPGVDSAEPISLSKATILSTNSIGVDWGIPCRPMHSCDKADKVSDHPLVSLNSASVLCKWRVSIVK